MGSVMLSGHGSRIIGVVLGFSYAHGMQSLQDPFVGELIGTILMETEENGYYVMLIGVVWNIINRIKFFRILLMKMEAAKV